MRSRPASSQQQPEQERERQSKRECEQERERERASECERARERESERKRQREVPQPRQDILWRGQVMAHRAVEDSLLGSSQQHFLLYVPTV